MLLPTAKIMNVSMKTSRCFKNLVDMDVSRGTALPE
jgi:hypothetical protein